MYAEILELEYKTCQPAAKQKTGWSDPRDEIHGRHNDDLK
jgi:hypothetical protein